jgi:hypothetical protein
MGRSKIIRTLLMEKQCAAEQPRSAVVAPIWGPRQVSMG